MMQLLVVAMALFVVVLCDVPAIHDAAVDITVTEGGPLTIKVPNPTNIWHRKFSDGVEHYVDACNPYLDICEKWRTGSMGVTQIPTPVKIAADGTLTMPKVTSADAAQYYTYFRADDGIHHYKYFNVKVISA